MGKTTNKKLIIFMIMIFCMFISFYSYRVNANQSNSIFSYCYSLEQSQMPKVYQLINMFKENIIINKPSFVKKNKKI